MTPEAFIVIALLLLAGGIVARVLFPKVRIEPAGIVRGTQFSDEKIRQAVIRKVKGLDVSKLPREEAQELIEETARHAAAEEYASVYRGLEVEVTETWPQAVCIISDNIAVIELWMGHTMDREGIRPVTVEVNRGAVLKLDPRRPIREAYEARYTPPPKAAVAAGEGTHPKSNPIKRLPEKTAQKELTPPPPVSKPVSEKVPAKRRLT